MIEVYTVYRYESSGKLIAAIGGGDYIPLSGNLTFLGKGSHKVNYKTVLRRTPYKIEVRSTMATLKYSKHGTKAGSHKSPQTQMLLLNTELISVHLKY